MASSWASLSAAKHLLALWIVAGHMDLQLLVVVVAEQVVNQRRSHRAQATVVGGVASFDDHGIPEVDFPRPAIRETVRRESGEDIVAAVCDALTGAASVAGRSWPVALLAGGAVV